MAKEKEKDDDDKGKEKEPEIVIVTDDPKNLDAVQSPATDDVDLPPSKKKDKPKEADEDEPEDEPEEDKEEARLGESEELEREAEAKEKQKATHKSRRQRQKEAERRLRTERDFLERRNEAVEKELIALRKRMDSTDKSGLDQRIQYTKSQIARAEKIAADATTAGKGDEAIEAIKLRDNMRDSLRNMEERKEQIEKQEREPPREQIDPALAREARGWMKRTAWYDPQLRDQDSKIARALDIAVEEDGFDPTTPEYFEELDKRIAKVLPHRAKKGKKRDDDADDEDIEDQDEDEEETPRRRQARSNGKDRGQQRPSGGPRFRTGGPGRDLRSNEVFLSPERIAAMKEVGAWDDPVLRQKYLKKYQEWDRDNPRE